MSQTFTLVNPDREEYAHLGEYTAMEHLTSAEAMAKIGYLVLASSMDGSTFSGGADPSDERLHEKMEELRQREIELELEKFTPETWEKYYERAKEEVRYDGQPIDEVDEEIRAQMEPDIKQEASRQVAKWSKSSYRNRNTFEWDESVIATIAASVLPIGHIHEYAGRWGGDRVALVGTYPMDESDVKDWEDATREHIIVELPNGETKRLTGRPEICNPDGSKPWSNPYPDIQYVSETGQHVLLKEYKYDDLDEDTVATVVELEEPQFDDITDGLNAEFEEFVGEDWIENQDQTVLNPDMMLSN